jgi:tripartite-type tricarboxylate transporter receptor subunit TctC
MKVAQAQPRADLILPIAEPGHKWRSIWIAKIEEFPVYQIAPKVTTKHRDAHRRNVMALLRRRFLHLAAGAVALPTLSRLAWAQTYPTRPVRILVGFPAGGPTDIFARLVGQWLSERLGQQFVVENRAGASSNIATEAVVNAAPDGHTLLLTAPANTINATLYDKLNFNFIRDIAPVAGIVRTIYVMVVHPSVPAKTVPEFIAYAKANPRKINMASAGNGTPQHIAGELFKMMAGVDMVHVPYRGAAPAVTDLLGGQVHLMFDNMTSSIESIRAGKLRPLAVTTTTRSELLPDVPTVGDFVPGFEATARFGLAAPRNTPAAIIDTINRELNASLADPKIKARFAELGGTVIPGSPADFGKLIAEETEKWAKVIRAGSIKPE